MLSTAAELGVGVTAYGELAGLLLPRSSTMTVHLVLNTIQEIAARTGVTVSQVAIAWTLARDSKVVPLVEGRYGSRLTDVLAATRLRMSLDDLARIDAALGKDTDIAAPRPKQAPERSHGRKAEREALAAALTGREMDVLLLLTKGMTNRAVGRQLGIAERTVRDHVAGVLLKLRVKSRVEAAVVATKWDLGRL